MPNYADLKTEAERQRLEARINEIYKETHEELSLRYEEYMDEYKERYKKELAAYKRGEYTKEQFLAWEQTQLARGEKWKKMRDDVADRLTKANQMAADYINGKTPDVFMLNANYTAYEIEKASGIAFDIYSEETIERLIRDNPRILPPARVNAKIDKKWNMDNLQRELASAILQGKSIDELASAFQHTENMDRVAALRHARTAMTGAQNGGRQLMLEKAVDEGINARKQWLATLDGRTRDSHQHMDGETVGVKESFSNGCEFPGDPAGHPKEVYNCRCTLVYELDGLTGNGDKRILRNEEGRNDYDRKITYTGRDNTKSYKEWLKNKLQQQEKMSKKGANWYGTEGVKHSIEELEPIIQEAKKDNIKLLNPTGFDGDLDILKDQIAIIAEMKNEYKIDNVFLEFRDLKNPDDFAITNNNTITYNRGALRNAEVTKEQMKGNNLAAENVNGITYHEMMHVANNNHKNLNGFEIAQEAYYNITNNKMEQVELLDYLESNISEYATLEKETASKRNTNRYKELIPEVITKNAYKKSDFTKEFKKIVKEKCK